MADEVVGKGSKWGPFELGRRYSEVEPGLGVLHEAWHVRTGKSALVLHPGEGVEWQFAGRWQLLLSSQPDPPSMSLQVEEAPGSARMVEMADMLVLMTAAIQRVEDSPRVHDHFKEAQTPAWMPATPRVVRFWRLAVLVCGAAFVGGLGWGLMAVGPSESTRHFASGETRESSSLEQAPQGVAVRPGEVASIAYPLPTRPFRNQHSAPCDTKRGEVEINKGCWVELAARPPCTDLQAEHQGKCYLPSLKLERPPQSAQP